MLDENILVIDIDPEHWARLLGFFGNEKRDNPSILLLLVEKGVCLKALHLETGAILNFDYGTGDLAKIADREGVDFVGRVDRGFLQQAFAAGQRDVHFDDDYVSQLMTLFNSVIDYTEEEIAWHPHRPRDWRPLFYERAQKLFDRFLPDGRTFLFLLVHQGRPYTSLILGKRSGDLSLMTTLDTIGRAHEPLDPETDLPQIIETIEEKFEPVHLTFVMEKRAFEEMLAGRRPITYLRAAIRHGRAFLEPFRWRLRLVLWAARVFKKL